MNFLLTISRSIISYTIFRTTRAIVKTGYDAAFSYSSNQKLGHCNNCGRIEDYSYLCSRCNSVMFKMYKQYEDNINLVDESLII